MDTSILLVAICNLLVVVLSISHQVYIKHFRKSKKSSLEVNNIVDHNEETGADGVTHVHKHHNTKLKIDNLSQRESHEKSTSTGIGKASTLMPSIFKDKTKDVANSDQVNTHGKHNDLNVSIENVKAEAQIALSSVQAFLETVKSNNTDLHNNHSPISPKNKGKLYEGVQINKEKPLRKNPGEFTIRRKDLKKIEDLETQLEGIIEAFESSKSNKDEVVEPSGTTHEDYEI